jgi:PhoH-like ATPase
MPLPKPPAKKGDRLQAAAFETQAAPRTDGKRGAKTRAAEPPAQTALDLHDGRAEAVAAAPAPVAFAPLRTSGPAPSSAPAPAPKRTRTPRGTGPAKLFVLDTNVLMHDPMSLFRFEEHDVFLPMITLEELDGHKKGMSEVARSVRQVSRELDALASFSQEDGSGLDATVGIALAKTGHREAGGKLFFQTLLLDAKLPAGLPQGKADNQILGVVQALRDAQKSKGSAARDVVLVSKDINMRVKARALGLPAEDYYNDKTLEDGDLLYTGVLPLPADFWDRNKAAAPTTASAGRWCPR